MFNPSLEENAQTMVLRKILAPLSTEFATSRRPDAVATRDATLASSLKSVGLLVAACVALALHAVPVHAQENNPEESDIIYEDVDPPDGGTEQNPEDSDIVYEDFPNDLPEGEGGNDPAPIGEQPLHAVPEPATLALMLAGGAGALLMRRRRAQRS